MRLPPIAKRKTGGFRALKFNGSNSCEFSSAEEDSEDSQELPVDPQAAVLATSASQVKNKCIHYLLSMTSNSPPPPEDSWTLSRVFSIWVPFWNTLALRFTALVYNVKMSNVDSAKASKLGFLP